MIEPLQCILGGGDCIPANHLQLTISDASYFLVRPHGSTPSTQVSTHIGVCSQKLSTAAPRASIADASMILMQSSTQGTVALALANNAALPCQTECILQGPAPKSYAKQLWMVYNVEASVDTQFCIARTINQANQRRIPVRITNISSSPVELHAGQRTPSFSTVFEKPSFQVKSS